MKLEIIRPEKTEAFDVNWIEVNTPVGNLVIQQGHAPTILTLSKNKEIVYELKKASEKKTFVAERGILSVTRKSVTLIL